MPGLRATPPRRARAHKRSGRRTHTPERKEPAQARAAAQERASAPARQTFRKLKPVVRSHSCLRSLAATGDPAPRCRGAGTNLSVRSTPITLCSATRADSARWARAWLMAVCLAKANATNVPTIVLTPAPTRIEAITKSDLMWGSGGRHLPLLARRLSQSCLRYKEAPVSVRLPDHDGS